MRKKKSARPPVIGVDFDGTLCQIFKSNVPYIPKSVIRGKPNKNVVEACRRYRRSGCRIVVYTSRWWGDYHWLKQWLDKYDVPYDDIVPGKFKADAFIDDTTVNPSLDRDWEDRLCTILGKDLPRGKCPEGQKS
ncbi:MAG TPA: hypothetical protein P5079_05155 [Elusimicrobiota bacterium]|nr:hypothetical protein [Elusimicrobiota bacterium]